MPLTYYEAWDGGNDGRDCTLIGRYETRELAEKYAEGRGTMGYGSGDIREVEVHSVADEKQIEKDKAILETLTPEQRAALKRQSK